MEPKPLINQMAAHGADGVHLASSKPIHSLQFLKVDHHFSLFGQICVRIIPAESDHPVAQSGKGAPSICSNTDSEYTSESPLAFHTTHLSLLHPPAVPSNFKIFRGASVPKHDKDETGELVADIKYKPSDILSISGLDMLVEFPGKETCKITRHGLWREYIFDSTVQEKEEASRPTTADSQFSSASPERTSSLHSTPSTSPERSPTSPYAGRRRLSVVLRGTKSAVRLFQSQHPNIASSTLHNGNLKFMDKDDSKRIIGLWENDSDGSKLGALHLFGKDSEWGGVGRSIEEMVCVVLAVVCCERVGGKGWLGGMGK
ncbi:MAG: hypothetical protein M1834_000208 [Cirrosporium novae-zelandiae]|nr:MAG: hypothetical protein M1834_000208 [Cirrosporium novae-zelandiae]